VRFLRPLWKRLVMLTICSLVLFAYNISYSSKKNHYLKFFLYSLL
jgi:hypothetical protein